MTSTRRKLGGVKTLVTLWLAVGCAAQTLTVRVYDSSGSSASQAERALIIAGLPLERAGVSVRWVACPAQPECASELTDDTLVLRLRIASLPLSSGWDRVLGTTVAGDQGGQYATTYAKAVQAVASESNVSMHLVLGHAIAHEIGHCVLGRRHAVSGLMRARWTRRDMEQIRRATLNFSLEEARRLTSKLLASQPAAALLTRR